MKYPKVVFLDAVGTLFGIRGSVGEVYSKIAVNFGVNVSHDRLNSAFFQSFKAAPPLAFSLAQSEQVPELEFNWWQAIARSTFAKSEVLDQFADFSAFFAELYDYFATAEPWYVYDDVLPALIRWQEAGIQLGIISNFDSRIHQVLEVLELRKFFGTITISSLAGVAKPNPEIFAIALKKHDCLPQEAWHIGDSLAEDYQGAKTAGIRPFLIQRRQEMEAK
jgi:putative hydrolase of the HAD superfamily